jgi:hypothetical protein
MTTNRPAHADKIPAQGIANIVALALLKKPHNKPVLAAAMGFKHKNKHRFLGGVMAAMAADTMS